MSCITCKQDNCDKQSCINEDQILAVLKKHIGKKAISDLQRMTLTEYNLETEDQCTTALLNATIIGCDGEKRTRAVPIEVLTANSGNRLGESVFTRFDFGCMWGCAVRIGETITRDQYPDFFEQVVDSFQPGLDAYKLAPEALGSIPRLWDNANSGVTTSQTTVSTGGNDEICLSKKNLPAFDIATTVNVTGGEVNIPLGNGEDNPQNFADSGSQPNTDGNETINAQLTGLNVTASSKANVGIDGNGTPECIDNRPKYSTMYEYIIVSTSC